MTTNPEPMYSFRIFANLEKEDFDALISCGTFSTAAPGTVLIEQGKSIEKLFLLVSGVLHARRKDFNNEIVLGLVQKGEWIGEISLFDPSEPICSVVALQESYYWSITRENFEEYLNNYRAAGITMLVELAKTLGKRMRKITRKLADEVDHAKIRESLFQASELHQHE